ncbi:hypothetical protein [Streptomyces iakyrus]|uniref:hypothetical protein n=1 Tax=Streptomyces iakyrus TaxID=68219 RepID=UPI003D911FC3
MIGLRGFYGLYVLHGLLLPDTPAQAALRQRIDDLGVFPLLDHVIAINPSPGSSPSFLVVCLEPFYDNLYETLMEAALGRPGHLSCPGDETGVVGFGEAWVGAVTRSAGPGAGRRRWRRPG